VVAFLERVPRFSRSHPQVVIAGYEQDFAETRGESGEDPAELVPGMGDVSCQHEDIVLVLPGGELFQPGPVLGVIDVQVRTEEEPGGGFSGHR